MTHFEVPWGTLDQRVLDPGMPKKRTSDISLSMSEGEGTAEQVMEDVAKIDILKENKTCWKKIH